MTLPADVARCPGYQADGEWREGCEDCMRRTAAVPADCRQVPYMLPPPIVALECEHRIAPDAADKPLAALQAAAALRGIS